jgi:hypothetical protein
MKMEKLIYDESTGEIYAENEGDSKNAVKSIFPVSLSFSCLNNILMKHEAENEKY